jgi:hypothetical protein
MFREYPNNVSLNGRGFIEQIGGYLLDGVAMSHKLRLPRDAWRSPNLCKLIHRGVADLTFDRFAAVHHRKCERKPLVVVSPNSTTRQWHRNPQPKERLDENASSYPLCRGASVTGEPLGRVWFGELEADIPNAKLRRPLVAKRTCRSSILAMSVIG